MKSLWYVKYTVFLLFSLLSIFSVRAQFCFISIRSQCRARIELGAEEVIRLSGLQTGMNIISVDGAANQPGPEVTMVEDVRVIRHLALRH